MDQASAERLRDRVNAMLEECKALPEGQRPWGVNWGDLKVRDIVGERSFLHGGGMQVYVEVEEAAPGAGKFFTDRLNEPGIVVRCEW